MMLILSIIGGVSRGALRLSFSCIFQQIAFRKIAIHHGKNDSCLHESKNILQTFCFCFSASLKRVTLRGSSEQISQAKSLIEEKVHQDQIIRQKADESAQSRFKK